MHLVGNSASRTQQTAQKLGNCNCKIVMQPMAMMLSLQNRRIFCVFYANRGESEAPKYLLLNSNCRQIIRTCSTGVVTPRDAIGAKEEEPAVIVVS